MKLGRYILDHGWAAKGLLFALETLLRMPAGSPPWRLGRKVEIAVTKRLRLFDRAYYLEQFEPGKAPTGIALRDYIEHGDALGRHPSPLFDPQYYRARCAGSAGRRVNALAHYGLFGRFRGISPSPWFDVGYYLRSNGDVVEARIDPLQHFVRFGWREGRNPLPGLDLRVVLRDYPGLRVSKSNPLVHLLRDLGRARADLNGAHGAAAAADQGDDQVLLAAAHWAAAGLTPRAGDNRPQVDVLVPVYDGRVETLRCLWSVLASPVDTAFELIVIDDAGPDETLSALLHELAESGLFTLRRNAVNLGFVKTVNQGLRLHPDRDVVILNADTEVHNDWLDRLREVAASDAVIGCVTPLSNNATICSYPEPLHNNWLSLEVSAAELDRLAADANGSRWVPAPTGVGFCMYMRRACIAQVGLLDEKHFGRGYGEENDWCQRALGAGWLNALAGGVFVRHHGSVSFRAESVDRSARAQRTLQSLHPTYAAQVQRHIAADPLWRARALIDLARLALHRRERNALLVSHDRGGGTERHLMEQSAALQADGYGVFELRPSKRPGALALNHPQLFGLHALTSVPVAEREFFLDALVRLGITTIQVHQTIDFPDTLPELLLHARDRLGIELQFTLHDYHVICPRINLAAADGRYCGEPDEAGCNACLASDGLRAKSGDIVSWRRRQHAMLAEADRVLVPDEDVALRLRRYFPTLQPRVCPHDEPLRAAPRPAREHRTGPVRVLVLGAIGRIKGYDVLLQCALAARRLQLPIEFFLLGFSMDDARLAEAGVGLLGRYDDAAVLERIEACDPDLVFLPSTWPETYCYTLSAALQSGRPVVVFDLGAQARRTRAHARPPSCVLPFALVDHPEELVSRLLTLGGHPHRHGAAPELAAG